MTLDIFDKSLAGRRIRLLDTDDRWTRLKSGDLGTIQYIFSNLNEMCIAVNWDSGSNLSLIMGRDSYEILEDKEK